eukprot:gene12589-12721_t
MSADAELKERGPWAESSGRLLGQVLASRWYLEEQGYAVAWAALEDWLAPGGSASDQLGSADATITSGVGTPSQQKFVVWLAEQLKPSCTVD